MLCLLLISTKTSGQKPIELLGEPNESYGYLIWRGDTSQIKYYRYEIFEREFDANGLNLIPVQRGEVWGRSYLYIAPKYWRSSDLNGKQYNINIQAVSSDGSDILDGDLEICSGCQSSEEICLWECVSSVYAYRIQAFETNNFYDYRLEMARDTETDGISTPYYEWFSFSEFGQFVQNITSLGLSYRNITLPSMVSFQDLINVPPYRVIHLDVNDIDGVYRNSVGAIIEGDVYGIQKGLGQWYPNNSETIYGSTTNYCNLPGGAGKASFYTVADFFSNEANLGTGLVCADDLGQTGWWEWDDDNWGNTKDWWTFQVPVKYSLGDGDENGSEKSGIGVNSENWTEYVSDIFNFTLEPYEDADLRYSDILMNCQMMTVSKLTENGYTKIVEGSTTNFLNSDSMPNFPIINFEPGLHQVAIKRSGYPLMYGVFEIEESFSIILPHKDFFSASFFPNPNTEDYFFIDIQTTAKLEAKYEIFDSNGNLLYEYKLLLPKNHHEQHKITPENILPSGFLYHKFTFLDGSHETITTIKN